MIHLLDLRLTGIECSSIYQRNNEKGGLRGLDVIFRRISQNVIHGFLGKTVFCYLQMRVISVGQPKLEKTSFTEELIWILKDHGSTHTFIFRKTTVIISCFTVYGSFSCSTIALTALTVFQWTSHY